MLSYLIYGANEELKGRVELPSQKMEYTTEEIHRAFMERLRTTTEVCVWVDVGGGGEVVVKAKCHQQVKTILRSCCDRHGLSIDKHELKIGSTILPRESQIGFFVANNDKIKLIKTV